MTGAERVKNGYTAKNERTRGADAALRFGDCSLCLCLAVDAVASPSGSLFCRPCILANILAQRTAAAARVEAWEVRNSASAGLDALSSLESERERIASFVAAESGSLVSSSLSGPASASGAAVSGVKRPRIDQRDAKEIRAGVVSASPWAPGHEPSKATTTIISKGERPGTTTRDPFSNAPLKMKQLVTAKLSTRMALDESAGGGGGAGAGGGGGGDGDGDGGAAATRVVVCPTCTEPLALQQAMLIIPCGHVICASCVGAAVAKSKACTECGRGPLAKQDFIALNRSGGGYAKLDK